MQVLVRPERIKSSKLWLSPRFMPWEEGGCLLIKWVLLLCEVLFKWLYCLLDTNSDNKEMRNIFLSIHLKDRKLYFLTLEILIIVESKSVCVCLVELTPIWSLFYSSFNVFHLFWKFFFAYPLDWNIVNNE